ncbi:MAG: hypothetical protein PHU78_06235 [Heliobacteriaceae bacterium]|nr:hypothetical protein [Heliobacteriaceae bacterium]
MEDIKVLIFLLCIEPGILLYFGLTLLGEGIKLTRLIPFSISTGILLWIYRGTLNKYAFGLHIVPAAVSMVVLAILIGRIPPKKAIVAVFLGFGFLIGLDVAFNPVQVMLLGGTDKILSNPYLHIFAGWTIDGILLLIAWGVRYGRRFFSHESESR